MGETARVRYLRPKLRRGRHQSTAWEGQEESILSRSFIGKFRNIWKKETVLRETPNTRPIKGNRKNRGERKKRRELVAGVPRDELEGRPSARPRKSGEGQRGDLVSKEGEAEKEKRGGTSGQRSLPPTQSKNFEENSTLRPRKVPSPLQNRTADQLESQAQGRKKKVCRPTTWGR